MARRMGKNPAMVTYWMDHGMLDYVQLADGSRLIPEESIVALEKIQEDEKSDDTAMTEVEINETVALSEA